MGRGLRGSGGVNTQQNKAGYIIGYDLTHRPLTANAVSGSLFRSIRLLFFLFFKKNVQPVEEKTTRYCMGYIKVSNYAMYWSKIIVIYKYSIP